MRQDYIDTQRQRHGRKAVAVLPIHYPKEILTAMDLLAVEVWGPPGPARGHAAAQIQPYVCAIVRNALAFLAAGGEQHVDAVLFPHTCDSLQGVASLAADFGALRRPTLQYLHPKGGRRDSTLAFATAELRRLAETLARLTGHALDDAKLSGAIALHLEIHALRRRLLTERRHLPASDVELYRCLRRGEFLWPADHRAELEALSARLTKDAAAVAVPLMVSGYVPEPRTLLEALDRLGARIVADDYAAVGRRVLRQPVVPEADPWRTLATLAFAGPPCPTFGTPLGERLSYLDGLFTASKARGLVIHVVKFCDPELFQVPALQAHFAAKNAPVLVLETELEEQLSGQTQTRLEAFVEMVGNRGVS